MKTALSTQSLHPWDRLGHWLDVTCNILVKSDVRPHCQQSFSADITAGSLAELEFMLINISPTDIKHDKRHIPRFSDDDLLLCQPLIGQFIVEQKRRQAIIQPKEFTLLETHLPYTARLPSQSKMFIVKIPRRELECRIGRFADFVAQPIGSSKDVDSFTSSFLEMIPQHATGLSASNQEAVKIQLLDLLALSLGRRADKVRLSLSKEYHLLRLHTAMAARLSQPHVTVGAIAAAAGISVRYANALLANQGLSVSGLLQAMRLKRCKRALEDPSQAHRSISEIAYAWGFIDITHFGRRFKKMYGVLPSEFRMDASEKHAQGRFP